jgi:prepilin-type N-terminal cleavage/methylation domain-containing protein
MKRNQSGFTLIEIAIVLVIIGLLLGGVLKGQELINSARVKNLATDFKNIPVFIYGYQDKFRALPGDDAAVTTHVTGGTLASTPAGTQGNGVIGGNWNSETVTDESYLFWQHVRLAGLAPGATTAGSADYLPVNASGGRIGIQSGTSIAGSSPIIDQGGNALRGSYVICSTGILGKFVKQLDIQMDDGNTATGSMLAAPVSTYALGVSATATTAIDDATSYVVCMGV